LQHSSWPESVRCPAVGFWSVIAGCARLVPLEQLATNNWALGQ
jgi:hypothetical protein